MIRSHAPLVVKFSFFAIKFEMGIAALSRKGL